MSDAEAALAHYQALTAKVAAFFARVSARHGESMQCALGCGSCCQAGLSVTPVEAQLVLRALTEVKDVALEDLFARASTPGGERCVALAEDDTCLIYEGRPLVCRSHGVPLRQRELEPADRVSLPVIQACELNFKNGFDDVTEDCILDQNTLSTTLAAIDALWCDSLEIERGTRFDLAALIASAFDTDEDDDDDETGEDTGEFADDDEATGDDGGDEDEVDTGEFADDDDGGASDDSRGSGGSDDG